MGHLASDQHLTTETPSIKHIITVYLKGARFDDLTLAKYFKNLQQQSSEHWPEHFHIDRTLKRNLFFLHFQKRLGVQLILELLFWQVHPAGLRSRPRGHCSPEGC